MSFTYTGDDTLDSLISASTLPNDGDYRDVASVNVSFQALWDSMATISSGDPILTGTPRLHGGFNTGNASTSIIFGALIAKATTTFDTASTTNFTGTDTFTSAGAHHVASGAVFQIDAGGRVDLMGTASELRVHSGSKINFPDGDAGTIVGSPILAGVLTVSFLGEIDLNTGALDAKSGSTIRVRSGATFQLDSGATVTHNANLALGGSATFTVNGTLDVASGANFAIDAGANVVIASPISLVGGGHIIQRPVLTTPTPGSGAVDVTYGIGDCDEVSVGALDHASTISIHLSHTGASGGELITVTLIPNRGSQNATNCIIYDGSGTGSPLIDLLSGGDGPYGWARFRFRSSDNTWILDLYAIL